MNSGVTQGKLAVEILSVGAGLRFSIKGLRLCFFSFVAVCATVLCSHSVSADPDNKKLVIDGIEFKSTVPAPEGSPYKMLYSGWHYRSPEVQSMQMDDVANPGFIAVERGQQLWATAEGAAGESCAGCHGDASESMKNVRAKMPVWDSNTGKPSSLEMTINACRVNHMKVKPWAWDSDEMLAMNSWVGLQSRAMPVAVKTDGPIAEWIERGKEIYYTAYGQLGMKCSSCHEDYAGKQLRSDHLSQGHINGFPVHHSAFGIMSSVHKRFTVCMSRIRAVPFEIGSDEFLALETYLAARGNGLAVETPSVRSP